MPKQATKKTSSAKTDLKMKKGKTVIVPSPVPYQPVVGEKYMSVRQLRYFKKWFEQMRRDILNSAERLMDTMKDDVDAIPDENDRASKESEFAVELRERERETRLLNKIHLALLRIEKKEFGYCIECGENIGINRLLARPVATLCFECKNVQEEFEKSGGSIGSSTITE